jgi:hypothetical protein
MFEMFDFSWSSFLNWEEFVLGCKTSHFQHGVDDVFTLVGCYVACAGSCLAEIQDSLSVPSQ